MHPVSFNQNCPQNRAFFIWNIFYGFFSWYCVTTMVDPAAINQRKKIMDFTFASFKEKPLFNIIFRFGLSVLFPIGYFWTTMHFLVSSLKQLPLLKWLDSFCCEVPKKALLVIIVVDHLMFIAMYRIFFSFYSFNLDTFKGLSFGLVIYISLYSMNCNTNIIFGLSVFYKFATWFELGRVQKALQNNFVSVNIGELEMHFQRLAKLNRKLNSFLSMPTTVVIFLGIFNFVSISAQAFVTSKMFTDILLNCGQFVFFISSLAILQDLINVKLETIEASLELYYHRNASLIMFKVTRNDVVSILLKNNNNVGGGNSASNDNLMEDSSENVRLRAVTFVTVYKSSFKLKLFELAHIDYGFLFAMTFFVVNYTVLVIQTSE